MNRVIFFKIIILSGQNLSPCRLSAPTMPIGAIDPKLPPISGGPITPQNTPHSKEAPQNPPIYPPK